MPTHTVDQKHIKHNAGNENTHTINGGHTQHMPYIGRTTYGCGSSVARRYIAGMPHALKTTTNTHDTQWVLGNRQTQLTKYGCRTHTSQETAIIYTQPQHKQHYRGYNTNTYTHTHNTTNARTDGKWHIRTYQDT